MSGVGWFVFSVAVAVFLGESLRILREHVRDKRRELALRELEDLARRWDERYADMARKWDERHDARVRLGWEELRRAAVAGEKALSAVTVALKATPTSNGGRH